MFKATTLRIVLIATATATILASGSVKAQEYQGKGPKMEFVRIPAGSFQMGSPASEKDRVLFDSSVREVQITKPFYMGKYEVTQAQWEAVMGTTVSRQRDKADSPWRLKGEGPEYPMYYVSWEEANEFCKRLGNEFRLLTEAEWEYACRAGSRTRFYYGDDPNYLELNQYARYWDNSNGQTHPVGQKKPNAWGLYDMHGNVDEWCSDLFDLRSTFKNTGKNVSSVATKNSYRVFRGGCWLDEARSCRSASRGICPQRNSLDSIGFRVVYTGRTEGDKNVLEITLPEKAGVIEAELMGASESRPQAISGVVRDEAGQPIDDLDIFIIPIRDWTLRQYSGGLFEMYRRTSDPNAPIQEYHLFAQNKERNLAVGVQIEEDANALEIKLKPGVILTGKVVGSDAKEIEGARVGVIRLQNSDWSGRYRNRVKSDSEGRFEIETLPEGYDYDLRASCLHYRVADVKVHSDDMRGGRITGLSIILHRGEFCVSGVVVDANGKPVADASVYCTGENQVGIHAQTDVDGRFKADGIFAGKVNVMAIVRGDDGKWAGGSITVEAGATDARVILGTGEWAPPPKGRACFPGDVGVWMNGAVVPVSEVERGRDVSGVPFGCVERIDKHEGAFECRDISLDSGDRISVVDSHCFMLDCGRWIAAQDLKADLRLKTITGTVGIKSVTLRPTPYEGKVYNLKICGSDQYAVGKDGVIVRDY